MCASDPMNSALMIPKQPRRFIVHEISYSRLVDNFRACCVFPANKPQSARYSAWGMPGHFPNLFVDSDLQRHEERRRQVAAMYQMSAIMNLEKNVDRVTMTFCEKMESFAESGEAIDITKWLHLYAFDVIAEIAVRALGTNLSGCYSNIFFTAWSSFWSPRKGP